MLGQISRAFHYRKKNNLVPLFKTFVRPNLEYAAAAWSPWLDKDIASMKRVQERLIRIISDAKGSSYEEKLKDAGLTTLKKRRERGDLIETFKVMNGLNRADKNKWLNIKNNITTTTRSTSNLSNDGPVRRDDFLFMEHVRLDIRKNFFNIRVIKEWNALPEKVRKQKTVNGFKNELDRWKDSSDGNQNNHDM